MTRQEFDSLLKMCLSPNLSDKALAAELILDSKCHDIVFRYFCHNMSGGYGRYEIEKVDERLPLLWRESIDRTMKLCVNIHRFSMDEVVKYLDDE